MNVYGVTPERVHQQRLHFMQGYNQSVMLASIADAAADLNAVIQMKGGDPAMVIDAVDVDWCALTVELGAAALYCLSVGAQQPPGNYGERFDERIKNLTANPQLLRALGTGNRVSDNTARSAATVRSMEDPMWGHQSGVYQQDRNTEARRRFLDPSRVRRSWRM